MTLGLIHARVRYLLWGATLGLWIFHVAAMDTTLARWGRAYAQMRGLVTQLQAFDRSLAPSDFALVIVPASYDGIPFARNAQGGLMMPPLFQPSDAHRAVVQINEELPEIEGKIAAGLVRTLRERDVDQYLAGNTIVTDPPDYPTRVACWDPVSRTLDTLDVPHAASPGEYGTALARAFARSSCSADTDTRSRSSIARRPARVDGG